MVPVAMFYGDNDFLADRTDVQYLLDNLPNIVHQKEFQNWNHVDFIIGKDAHQLLYTDIVNLMVKYQWLLKLQALNYCATICGNHFYSLDMFAIVSISKILVIKIFILKVKEKKKHWLCTEININ